uniref:non-specific serine/threonine protein kinase n=1 Tax=Myotis lucifugus TaxID=59463 RepID=G1QCN3_MYOLU
MARDPFAEVTLARHTVTSTEVAVKVVNWQGPSDVVREIHPLKELNHPNIIKLFEVIITEDHMYLFTQHVSEGTLFDYLEQWSAKITTSAHGPQSFNRTVHARPHVGYITVTKDLDLENIHLGGEMNVKLADFGFSRVFTEEKLTTFCGTAPYVAPELFLLESYEGLKVEVWSKGVVLYGDRATATVWENFEGLTEYILSGSFFI